MTRYRSLIALVLVFVAGSYSFAAIASGQPRSKIKVVRKTGWITKPEGCFDPKGEAIHIMGSPAQIGNTPYIALMGKGWYVRSPGKRELVFYITIEMPFVDAERGRGDVTISELVVPIHLVPNSFRGRNAAKAAAYDPETGLLRIVYGKHVLEFRPPMTPPVPSP